MTEAMGYNGPLRSSQLHSGCGEQRHQASDRSYHQDKKREGEKIGERENIEVLGETVEGESLSRWAGSDFICLAKESVLHLVDNKRC